MIKITYTSVDGVRKTRSFKSLKGARKFAHDMVGPQHAEGGHYAVSNDGVGKVEWAGITRSELFPYNDRAVVLNTAHEFYRKGNDLFCRQAGYTRNHEGQKFGRIVEVMDSVTGDNHDGFRLRHNDGETHYLFDEERKFNTFEAALAAAKQAKIDYLNHLNSEADAA